MTGGFSTSIFIRLEQELQISVLWDVPHFVLRLDRKSDLSLTVLLFVPLSFIYLYVSINLFIYQIVSICGFAFFYSPSPVVNKIVYNLQGIREGFVDSEIRYV